MNNYSEIEASDLLDLIVKPKVMLVDVRNDDEVQRGIIPGAIHIQLAMLPLQYEKLLKAHAVVFYCHSGIRSAHAADFAVSKGLKDVYNLKGGIVAWNKAGYTTSTKKQVKPMG
jgi:rhodanese-related sulfurtransferase